MTQRILAKRLAIGQDPDTVELAKGHFNPVDQSWLDNQINGQSSPWALYDRDKAQVLVKTSEFVQGGGRLDYQYDNLNGNNQFLLVNVQMRDQLRQEKALMMAPKPGAERGNRMATDIFGDQNRIVVTGPRNRNRFEATPVHLQTAIEQDKKPKFAQALPLAAMAEPASPAIMLNIEDVRSTGAPGVVFRVYLNEIKATAETNPDDANYVGSIAVFQSSSPHHRMEAAPNDRGDDFSFDISKLVQKLTERGQWNPDKIDVTFVCKGVNGQNTPKTEVTFDRVSISIDK